MTGLSWHSYKFLRFGTQFGKWNFWCRKTSKISNLLSNKLKQMPKYTHTLRHRELINLKEGRIFFLRYLVEFFTKFGILGEQEILKTRTELAVHYKTSLFNVLVFGSSSMSSQISVMPSPLFGAVSGTSFSRCSGPMLFLTSDGQTWHGEDFELEDVLDVGQSSVTWPSGWNR